MRRGQCSSIEAAPRVSIQPSTGRSRGRKPADRASLGGGEAPSVQLLRRDGASSLPSSERVYQDLRDQILTGVLVPNERLVELQLASEFNVSRTPIREALKRLAAEGLVSVEPLRGTVVRDIDATEVEDIYTIREVLDGLAVNLAAQRITAPDLAKLHLLGELMQESARARRWEAVVQINIKFHEVLYSAARNERLALIARSLQDAVHHYSSMAFTDPERVAEVLEEHEEIVAALETRDAKQAEALARRHMARARSNLSRLLLSDPARGK